jgi:RimJ/RimL family protein N-acetyltransferase
VAENLRQATTGSDAVAIRPASPRDATLLYHWRAEPSVRQYQPLSVLSLAQLRSELAGQNIENLYRDRGEKFQWIVEAPEPVGWITLVVANWEHGLAEVGYALGTRHQRQGIMRRALEALLHQLFSRTSLRRLEARCAVQNVASQTVLESLGFHREGTLRGFFVLRGAAMDNHLYAMLRDDWTGGL